MKSKYIPVALNRSPPFLLHSWILSLFIEVIFKNVIFVNRRLSPQKEKEYKEAIGKLFVTSSAPKDVKEHRQTIEQSAEKKPVKYQQSVSLMKGNQFFFYFSSKNFFKNC